VFEPGVILGQLRPSLAKKLNCQNRDIRVSLVAGHDTASAVAAIPSETEGTMFISSGTWSLLGIVTSNPILTTKAKEKDFSNEQGVFGTSRFLKNTTGMWLLEECRKQWEKEGLETNYEILFDTAEELPKNRCILDPNDSCFEAPASMTQAIQDYAKKQNQTVPQSPAEFTRVILDSLASSYHKVLNELKELAPFDIKRIHVIGGGARLDNLNQLIANVTGLPVLAGPVEATAMGNILMQAYANVEISNITELKKISKNSCEVNVFNPQ
jgi:rhamnulokinase